MFVVLVKRSNSRGTLEMIGPFQSEVEADNWAAREIGGKTWWLLMPLSKPE